MRRRLIRLRRQSSGEDRQLLDEAIRDSELLGILTERCCEECGCNPDDGYGSPITDFFEWLLANKDQILAFIKEIRALLNL